MKRSRYKSSLHIYVIFFILLIGTLAAGVGMVVYNITIQKPDGHVEFSKWPIDFTNDFSEYIIVTGDRPQIKQSGLKLLQENNLWIQIIDANGNEIQSLDKPQSVPSHYSPSAILNIYQNGIGEDSVFLGNLHFGDEEWTYMIGFPVQITKVTMYVSGDRFTTFKPIMFVTFGVTLLLLIITGFLYSFLVAKQTTHIRKSIREIASRTYVPVSNNSSFGDIYEELNAMNAEIQSSDKARAKDEKLREEWIANITHDLKTPLSPIRGYAELISAQDSKIEPDELKEYGDIILKNTAYAETLINDLKLTYQLKNGMLPLHKSRQNIVRFTKELVIDLLNNPEYEHRNISFCSTDDTVELTFDAVLLKRALNNLITNALVHNNSDTEISVSITVSDHIKISIQDNGCGMKKEELDNLFVRYYRGENTAAKPEGSGLGMAIAKQIIELHGGSILAESAPGSGTCITIEFAKQN
ncbi:MAG: HAMP domain-containing sensor histidine kinase [Oscillospiraceae bacterium]|jgi:signal transduction histidine kinase|nr:Putative two-component histidine kinase [Ruminococcaceae bacterium BL-4]